MPDGINYDAFSEALNDKADRDLQNVDTVSGGDAVIAFQRPTAENNYTWFRKYASGWVEQGGVVNERPATITLPVEMADTNYTLLCSGIYSSRTNGDPATWSGVSGYRTSTTQISLGAAAGFATMAWQVSGMAAQ